MPTNSWLLLLTALIPLLVGAIYYSPKVCGTKWMKVNGFTEESLAGANMMLIFALSYFLGIILSFGLSGIVIHQVNVYQMMIPEVLEAGSQAESQFNELMATYGSHHRNYGHGAVHGLIATLFIVLPLLAINALFERRGAAYIFIHLGYWAICLILIGAVLSQHLQYT